MLLSSYDIATRQSLSGKTGLVFSHTLLATDNVKCAMTGRGTLIISKH